MNVKELLQHLARFNQTMEVVFSVPLFDGGPDIEFQIEPFLFTKDNVLIIPGERNER